MKNFKDFLTEVEKIKPVSPAQRIPKRLPPKNPQNPKKSDQKPRTDGDKFEKSRDLGFRPYKRSN
jgi:hypothetical protein